MRDTLAEKIKNTILGPISGEKEKISFNPLNLYTTGILYPQFEKKIPEDPNEEVPSINNEEDDTSIKEINKKASEKPLTWSKPEIEDEGNEVDDELKLATNFSPSSMGFSFLVKENETFELTYSFGRYVKFQKEEEEELMEKGLKENEEEEGTNKATFKRMPAKATLECLNSDNLLKINGTPTNEFVISDENNFKVKLNFYVRSSSKSSNIKLITISLINALNDTKKYDNCIFQPYLSVNSVSHLFHAFPDNTEYGNLQEDSEALNNALLYREYNVYAMGHGVSVNWPQNDKQDLVNEIYTEVMPQENVYGVDFDRQDKLGNTKILEMKNLSGPTLNIKNFNKDNLFQQLRTFISKYDHWIKEQQDDLENANINEHLKKQGNTNLNICKILYNRLNRGIECLENNENALRAFYDANSAMFMQRVLGQFSSWRREQNNVIPGTDGYSDRELPDFKNLSSDGQEPTSDNFGFSAKWRPFQLAFFISQVEGIINPNSDDRDTTDLIWFPTGGGKTEAYLGLIAFTLFYRRLREDNPDKGAGVSVMMRYTLRMLNLDQFQRANILISACEIIRKNNEEIYGKIRFTSGIWVGQSLTPNRYKDTGNNTKDGFNSNIQSYISNIEQNQNDTVKFPPFLSHCPCCGNYLLKQSNTRAGSWGYFREYRIRDGLNNPKGNYLVSCTNKKCHFYTVKNTRSEEFTKESVFPYFTVDEEIYEQRPSLLFATVDKYAQIAWKRESANLFNFETSTNNERLYPGPDLIIQDELHLIGSSLGTIYGLFEYAIDKLCSYNSFKPKIVGATATAKNAEIQCKRLYNRKHFMQFPPPGISADDSFYMKKNKNDKNPRKYIGFMPAGFTSSTAIIRLASVLIETPNLLKNNNTEVDKYYTLLVYFNSLKELGKFRTFIDDDISAYRKFLDNSVINKIHENLAGREIELSSAMNADEISSALERLKKHKLPNERKEDSLITTCLASIGLRSLKDWQMTTNKKAIMTPKLFKKLNIDHTNTYETNKANFYSFLRIFFQEQSNYAVKIATATNMIATGVDISRLNLMLINGHPKSSSEYIQASSRVGREDPGLIFSFYSATKNRDRSQYENYKSFHQTFYKYVEPASVTPHSMPALEKVIPSIIIALVWILYRKSDNTPFKFNKEVEYFLEEIKEELKDRLGKEVDNYISIVFDNIIEKWKKQNPPERRFANFFDYLNNPIATTTNNEVFDVRSDLADLKTARYLIPKVSTMRDVEPSCNVNLNYNE